MTAQPKWEDLPDVLTPEDIRAYLRYESVTTVYSMFQKGLIRAIGYHNGKKSNRLWRATKRAFQEFLDGDGKCGGVSE